MNKYKSVFKNLVVVCSFLLVFAYTQIESMAFIQKDGTIIANTSLYESASDTSTVLMELEKDKAVVVNNQVDDSAGIVWYQLFVDGTTYGYVKAEVVSTGSTASPDTGSTVEPEAPAATTTYETYTQLVGTIGASPVNMRKEASTATDVILSLPAATKFDIIGETTGADNFVWYQMQIESDGQTLQGYVRSDLATTAEEERQREVIVEVTPEVEPEPEKPVVVSPYTVVQNTDEEGNIVWLLQDETGIEHDILSLLESEGKGGVGFGIILFIIILVVLLLGTGYFAVTYYTRLADAEDYLYELKMKKEKSKKETPKAKSTPTPEKKPMVTLSQPDLPPIKATSVTGKAVTMTSKPAGQTVKESQPVVRQTPKAKPASFVEPTMKKKVEVEKPKETYRNTTIKKPEVSQVPKSEDIIEATSRDLEKRFQEENMKPQKSNWKSKNFLTDDDDDLDFEFLKFDDDK